MRYDIKLTHGPVVKTEYIGNNTVVYGLENGEEYKVTFVALDGCIKRIIDSGNGKTYEDVCELDSFTAEDLAQWTADNWFEVEELISYKNEEA